MATFIMFTCLNNDGFHAPQDLEQIEKRAMARVREECPDVQWERSYASMGPYDYVDIFRADGIDSATKVSMLIRSCGDAHTEIWPITEWSHFKMLAQGMPPTSG